MGVGVTLLSAVTWRTISRVPARIQVSEESAAVEALFPSLVFRMWMVSAGSPPTVRV